MILSLLVPTNTLIKGYLKNKYLSINEIFSSKKSGMLLKKILTVESLLYTGAGAGASNKTDRLRNMLVFHDFSLLFLFQNDHPSFEPKTILHLQPFRQYFSKYASSAFESARYNKDAQDNYSSYWFPAVIPALYRITDLLFGQV